MSEQLEKFRTAVCGYLESNGIVVNRGDIGDDIIIEAQGKIVQLRLVEGSTLLISTVIYFNMIGEEDVDAKLISEFNAYNMLDGGYRIMVEPETLSLYVEEGVCVDNYDADALSTKLYDFVKRSVACTRWYMKSRNDNNDISDGKLYA